MASTNEKQDAAIQTKKLLRYRYPLAVGLIVNCFFVARVPSSNETDAATKKVAAKEAKQKADPDKKDDKGTKGDGQSTTNPPAPDQNQNDPSTNNSANNPSTNNVGPVEVPVIDVPPPPRPTPNNPSTNTDPPPTFPPLSNNNPRATRPDRPLSLSGLAQATRAASRWFPENRGGNYPDPFAGTEEPSNVDTQGPEQGADQPQQLVLENPADNGGRVLLLVNGELIELAPGQSRTFSDAATWMIEFHRGNDFGEAQSAFGPGTFRFSIGPTGWQLD